MVAKDASNTKRGETVVVPDINKSDRDASLVDTPASTTSVEHRSRRAEDARTPRFDEDEITFIITQSAYRRTTQIMWRMLPRTWLRAQHW
jgi:hypothetical protein